jgi:uncharacterized membrane protein
VKVPVPRGQALVEFALVAPVLMMLLLGVLAGGIHYLAAVQQASATTTIAAWAGEHPADDLDAFAGGVSDCPAVATWSEHTVVVTLSCPSLAGKLLPVFPSTVDTSATAFVP